MTIYHWKLTRVIPFLLLVFSATVQAQEVRQGNTSLPDVGDSQISKQLARDKQLLEIWKDHVRTLTKERDEAYQKIQELQNNQDSPSASVPSPDTETLNAVLAEKEAALRQAETLRSQVESLKTHINQLETLGKNGQFAVEVQPVVPAANPASQKFYADLTKNYMLQQDSVKKLKAEIARLETENQEKLRSKTETEAGLQKEYNLAIGRVHELESQSAPTQARLKESLAGIAQMESQTAKLRADKDSLEKNVREASDEIEALESQKTLLQDELKKKDDAIELSREDRERAVKEVAAVRLKLESLEAKHRTLEANTERVTVENRQVWAENQKLAAASKDLSARLQTATQKSADLEIQLKESLAQMADIKKEADETRQSLENQVQSLEGRLKANAADIQNLKENFNTLLEPLVSSFDDRK